jgi:beta-glucosidase
MGYSCTCDRIFPLLLTLLLLSASATVPCTVSAQAAGERVESLIARMTLEEKLSLLHGTGDPLRLGQAGYLPGVPRLGIPPLRLSDGPAGIRMGQPATALPAPVTLGASFDPELARRYGQVIGIEGRARHQDVLLAPMVNIIRVPQAGRNFETFSEDPLLSARLVAAEVRGAQDERLIATIKHYVANNQENQRQSVSAEVDERTFHEIYLPGFEAAVRAGAGSVMGSYNKVNGTYACENPVILEEVLRGEWGFTGWVMSDWGATHSAGPALQAGLDMEMPGSRWFGEALRAAVDSGRVSPAEIDRSVRRILVTLERFGLLDTPAPARPVEDEAAHARTAREVATAGAVLLRNRRRTLPLDAGRLSCLLVIGPTARTPLVGGGGSAKVPYLRAEPPLEAITRRLHPGTEVRYRTGIERDGTPIPAGVLTPAGGEGSGGLLRTAADGRTRIDSQIDYTGATALPAGASFTWTGTLTVPESGDYDLKVQTMGGRASLQIDGRRVGGRGGFGGSSLIPNAQGLSDSGTRMRWEAGERHELSLTFEAGNGPAQVRLAWVTPQGRARAVAEAAEAARTADAVILYAHCEGTEGRDRETLDLPEGQDALIEAVAAAAVGPVVVVLYAGAPVLMPWLTRTDAVLLMWYPGQEGAEAGAALLFGEANPGGKLPVTFPRREEDTPVALPERYPGVEGLGAYSEGILVGYRWYDQRHIEPLFPFGHGLSYTDFRYSDLEVEEEGEGLVVRFRLKNFGRVRGAEVPQVYLGPARPAPVPMERRRLAGFARLELDPGQEVTVMIPIGRRELSYWSVEVHDWVLAPGRRTVYVGASSRDLRLQRTVRVPR